MSGPGLPRLSRISPRRVGGPHDRTPASRHIPQRPPGRCDGWGRAGASDSLEQSRDQVGRAAGEDLHRDRSRPRHPRERDATSGGQARLRQGRRGLGRREARPPQAERAFDRLFAAQPSARAGDAAHRDHGQARDVAGVGADTRLEALAIRSARLDRRAQSQHQTIERLRLDAATQAFAEESSDARP